MAWLKEITERCRIDVLAHTHPDWCYTRQALKNHAKDRIYRLFGIQKQMEGLRQAYVQFQESVYSHYCRGKVIVDIGCGKGDKILSLSRSYGATCYGIDYSLAMIKKARHLVGPDRVFIGSAAELPLADKSVDVVMMDYLIHHLPPGIDEASVNEARRVARDVVIINDSFSPQLTIPKYLALIYWKLLDGGYRYRSRQEWYELLDKKDIIEETWGKGPMRFCMFVVKAS